LLDGVRGLVSLTNDIGPKSNIFLKGIPVMVQALRKEKVRRESKKPIHAIRLDNLVGLIAARYEANTAKAARALERSHTFVWQLLNKRRSIGEDTARHIEKCLGLKYGALDLDVSGLLAQSTELRVGVGDDVKRFFVVNQVDSEAQQEDWCDAALPKNSNNRKGCRHREHRSANRFAGSEVVQGRPGVHRQE
jgi:hypothetical protein